MIETSNIEQHRIDAILGRQEGQFCDFKAKPVTPAKLTQTLSAFANADGGEVFVGIGDPSLPQDERWRGFENEEEANAIVQTIEQFFPVGADTRLTFLAGEGQAGLVLHIEVDKSADIKAASNGVIYARRSAQNLKQDTDAQIDRIRLNKGLRSHEDVTLNTDIATIANSEATIGFMIEAIPTAEPEAWLRKQKLIVNDLPTVSGILLFSDEPQTDIPKAAIKIYRYKTTAAQGTRETLAANPISVEGCAYNQIYNAVDSTKRLMEEIPVMGPDGLETLEYPTEALHEIVTNAVIHRGYSIQDDIHIRIFDNRIEVQSPGTLPGHVTVQNILAERAARNPKTVRLLNKFPNPPNKDVGEGLNTAFEAMRSMHLKDPIIEQRENSVLVSLRHEKLGTPEQIIVEYLRDNVEINNATARELCIIGSENTAKRILQKMVRAGLLEAVEGRPRKLTGYVRGPNYPKE